MLLSYLEAFRQKESGMISWEEYIHHLFARFTSFHNEHDDDDVEGLHKKLRDTDPFGYCIYCWSKDIDKVKDSSPFEDVFRAYSTGSLDDVQNKLGLLEDEHAKGVRKAVALLALQERRADMLKLCLDRGGFSYESSFRKEANRLQEIKDPETFRVLEQSHFRQTHPRRTRHRRGRRSKKGRANDPCPGYNEDDPSPAYDEDDDESEEDDDAEADGEAEEADDDNMEEIDTGNIVGTRTRGRAIDYAQAAKELPEEDDDDDDDDDDFED